MKYSHYRISKDTDEHIDQIHELTLRMKYAGQEMGVELNRQQKVIAQLDQEMQMTEGTLQTLNNEVGELLQTHDVSQVCACLMLCCLMIVLIILIIIF